MDTYNISNTTGLSNIFNRQYYYTVDLQYMLVGINTDQFGRTFYTFEGYQQGNEWQVPYYVIIKKNYNGVEELNPSIIDWYNISDVTYITGVGNILVDFQYSIPSGFATYTNKDVQNMEEVWFNSPLISGSKCFTYKYVTQITDEVIDYLYDRLVPQTYSASTNKTIIKYPCFSPLNNFYTDDFGRVHRLSVGDRIVNNPGFDISSKQILASSLEPIYNINNYIGVSNNYMGATNGIINNISLTPFELYNISYIMKGPIDYSNFPRNKYPSIFQNVYNSGILTSYQNVPITVANPKVTGESYNIFVPSWYSNYIDRYVADGSAYDFLAKNANRDNASFNDFKEWGLYASSGIYPHAVIMNVNLSGHTPYFSRENNLANIFDAFDIYNNSYFYYASRVYSRHFSIQNLQDYYNICIYQTYNFNNAAWNINPLILSSGVLALRHPISNELMLQPTTSSILYTYAMIYDYTLVDKQGNVLQTKFLDKLMPATGIILPSGLYSNSILQFNTLPPDKHSESLFNISLFPVNNNANPLFNKYGKDYDYVPSPIAVTSGNNIYYYEISNQLFNYGVGYINKMFLDPNRQDWKDNVLFSCPNMSDSNFPKETNVIPNQYMLGSWIAPRKYLFGLSYGSDPTSTSWYKIKNVRRLYNTIEANGPIGSSLPLSTIPYAVIDQWESQPTPNTNIPPYIKTRSSEMLGSLNIITTPHNSGHPLFSIGSVEKQYEQSSEYQLYSTNVNSNDVVII